MILGRPNYLVLNVCVITIEMNEQLDTNEQIFGNLQAILSMVAPIFSVVIVVLFGYSVNPIFSITMMIFVNGLQIYSCDGLESITTGLNEI